MTVVLLAVEYLDELGSGVPGMGAPEIQVEFSVSYGLASGWLQLAFAILAIGVEPPLLLLADRYPRRRFVLGGLWALAVASFAAALAPGYAWLFVAIAVWGAASGVGVNVAQATLMDSNPDGRERTMTRWTLLGALGDLTVPLLFAALAALALGWRTAFAIAAVLFAMVALALPRRFPRSSHATDPSEPRPHVPLRVALVEAFRNRKLMVWLAASMLCSLLDEIWIALGALHLRDALGADASERSFVFTALILGGFFGLVVAERLVDRVEAAHALVVASILCLIAYIAWVFAPSLLASAGWAFVAAAAAAPLYPLVHAQAYRALPERSGTVAAVHSLFSWFQLAALPLLAIVADTLGLVAAMLLLALQPVGVGAIAATQLRTRSRA